MCVCRGGGGGEGEEDMVLVLDIILDEHLPKLLSVYQIV